MRKKIHAACGAVALLTICVFWSATMVSELFGDPAAITVVKNFVLMGMALLIPAMAGAGGSGFLLGRKWRGQLVERKKRRMKIIAANGLLVLLPAALFLATKANAGEFDTAFAVVQVGELAVGGLNIALMSMNMRDGFALRRKPITAAMGGGGLSA
ncbi:MAG: hypothetical protein KF810_09015 [Rhizobiaceae bacterium]|nr:hypothetical protein [Rhizobiaceae bacterium]